MIIEARDDVVSLSGSLERNLWPAIQAAANLLLRQHPNGILIDASQITHCSEEGARTFLDAMEYIERHRARIMVCHPPDAVLETLKHVPGVRSQLPIAESCEQGRASLELYTDIRRRHPATIRPGDGSAAVRPRLVMIPLTDGLGNDKMRQAVGLALQVGMRRRGNDDGATPTARHNLRIMPLLHFVYVMEVPRTMPINSPLTDEEVRAREALTAAAQLADSLGVVSQSSVARTRDAGEEIVEQATQIGAEIVTLSLPPQGSAEREKIAAVVDTVLQRAPCEVMVMA